MHSETYPLIVHHSLAADITPEMSTCHVMLKASVAFCFRFLQGAFCGFSLVLCPVHSFKKAIVVDFLKTFHNVGI